jgi:hypothetical protein
MINSVVLDGRAGQGFGTIASAKNPTELPPSRQGPSGVSERVPAAGFHDDRSSTAAIGVMLPAEDSDAERAGFDSSERAARRLKGMFLREATWNG